MKLKQKVGFGTAFPGESGMQRFAHEDKWREIRFSEPAPSFTEAIGWTVICVCFVGTMFAFLWA